MFTIDQIKTAHSKVKSGADFPKYIQEIKSLGVTHYETFVTDGRTAFQGVNHSAQSEPKYSKLTISTKSDKEYFVRELKDHQQGKSDYLTFCKISAESGVEKWVVDISTMTCTYYDLLGNEMLIEQIPLS